MKSIKELHKQELSKTWKDQKMIDYCLNSVGEYVVFPDNTFTTIDKPKIETRFCFGESGYDYEDALKAADHARKSEQYFISENLRSLDETIDDLKSFSRSYWIPLKTKRYISSPDNSLLVSVSFEKRSRYESDSFWRTGTPLTEQEIKLLIEGYEKVRASFEKRLRTYLKRYGLTKVHAWTYWRDA